MAESQRAEAAAALEGARTAALRQVSSAYDELEADLVQYQAALALRDAAQTSFGSARDAFTHGVGTLQTATEAQTALAAATASLAKTRGQCSIDSAALAFATGVLTRKTSASLAP